jgi:hypothetical protein
LALVVASAEIEAVVAPATEVATLVADNNQQKERGGATNVMVDPVRPRNG